MHIIETKNKPIYVIYHSADLDGIASREVARYFLESSNQPVEFIGWDYGMDVPAIPEDCELYMVDIHVPALMSHPKLIWIDHHISAIERFPETIKGIRISGVAACRLTYQWLICNGHDLPPAAEYGLPIKENGRIVDYTPTMVQEPTAIRLLGQYDVHDLRNPDVEAFQFGMKAINPDQVQWGDLIRSRLGLVRQILDEGYKFKNFADANNSRIALTQSFDLRWQGLNFLALNAAYYNSGMFKAAIKPHHDALLGFKRLPDRWSVSLYHIDGKEDVQLLPIVTKFEFNGTRGGGHAGACGFSCAELPFSLAPAAK